MLRDIVIEDLGVISRTSVELTPGLTVLTGETGAGKTMVVTGLRLLTGGRADASRVRSGTAQAVVEGTFSLDESSSDIRNAALDLVNESGGRVDENGEIIASRVVRANGRSRAHLGGRAVPAGLLGTFTQELLTIHGQNDQLRLLSPARQLAALDQFDDRIAPLLRAYTEKYDSWQELDKDLNQRIESRRELAQEADRLTFAIADIDRIAPEPGEDEATLREIRRLQDVDSLREAAATALAAIDGPAAVPDGYSGDDDSPVASDLVGQAQASLQSSSDPQLGTLAETLGEVASTLGGIAMELGSYLSDLPADPAQLDSLLTRQQDLRSLTRKYAADIDGVLDWRDKAARRLAKLDTSTEAIDLLRTRTATARKDMIQAGKKLSTARRAAARTLAKRITAEIHELAMPKARIEVSVTETDPHRNGCDHVEFLLAASPVAPARPLASAASGGELSRVMLACEVIVASASSGATLVFDEVDAGVGGRAAVHIGRRLARLALRHQVLVVTHLPQVAAYADRHIQVAKEVSDEAVVSGVKTLDREERVEEIARMLAGLDGTETGRAHAAELLARAEADKQALSA